MNKSNLKTECYDMFDENRTHRISTWRKGLSLGMEFPILHEEKILRVEFFNAP